MEKEIELGDWEARGLNKVTLAKEGFIAQRHSLEVFDDKDLLVRAKLEK